MLDIKNLSLLVCSPVEYRVEQLKLGRMYNVINGSAPEYMNSQIETVHHDYSTTSSDLCCIISGVNSFSSFFGVSNCVLNISISISSLAVTHTQTQILLCS